MLSMLLAAGFSVPALAQSNNRNSTGECPAQTCTDHSYDHAYSAKWAGQAQSPAPGTVVRLNSQPNIRTWGGMRDRHYNMEDFTVRGRYRNANMSSPYRGEDAPSYDGPARNAYRNIRANNTSEPLPPNNGQ